MPKTDFSTLQVSAVFTAANGKAEKALALAIQFFNAPENRWTTLNTALNTEKGLLQKSIKLSPRNTAAALLKALSAGGGIPPFRLVLEASLKQKTVQVAAEAPAVQYLADTQTLALGFGRNFAQPADIVKNYLHNEAAAESLLYAGLPAPEQAGAAVEKLDRENQKLNAALAAAQEKIKAALETAEAAKAAEAALRKEMTASTKMMTAIESEMEKVRKKAAETESRLTATMTLAAEKEEMLMAAAATETQLQEENLLLRRKLETLNTTISSNVNTIEQLNEQLKISQAEVASRDSTILNQAEMLKQQEEKIRQLTLPLAEYKPAAQPVSTVYASILDEFKKTNELNRNTAYRVSNISLNLKTFVEHDATGIRMQLVDANKLSGLPAEALSDFRVEIGEASGSSSTSILLPDLTGLTETAARRILVSLGLSLKPVYQDKKDVPDGQAFRQSPAAGQVEAGETITIVFSKHNA